MTEKLTEEEREWLTCVDNEQAAELELEKLQASVDLQADLAVERSAHEKWWERAKAAEAQLAEARAENERLNRALLAEEQETESLCKRLGAARALLDECTNALVPNWPAIQRGRDWLAANPVSPRAECVSCGVKMADGNVCKACVSEECHHRNESPRAAAERAVLDAMAAVPKGKLVLLAEQGTQTVAAVAEAELTRRAVKP